MNVKNERQKIMKLLLNTYHNFVVFLFVNLLMLPTIYAAQEGINEQQIVSDKIDNVPLFLSLIELNDLNAEALEKAKQAIKNSEEIKVRDKLNLNPFHIRNGFTIKEKMESNKSAFCLSCHLPLPHQKSIHSRTFNNMHSRYIACETCHLDREKVTLVESLHYLWFDLKQRIQVKDIRGFFMSGNKTDKNNKPEYVKITPFYQHQVAVITRQHLYTNKLIDRWETSDLLDKAKIKARIHQFLKPEGEECGRCHTKENSLLDMLSLGADNEQLEAYENNSIVSFFSHYGLKKSTEKGSKKMSGYDEKISVTSAVEPQGSIQRIRITELLN